MHWKIQDLLVFHQFYTSTLLSSVVLILFPINCILCIWQYFTLVSCLITTQFAAHEGWTWNLQNFLKLTKKGWNAYNLYIWHWQSKLWTDIPPTINRRFHGRGRHLGCGANAEKFTVNVWEKSWFWCSITRGSLTFYSFYELQTKNAS